MCSITRRDLLMGGAAVLSLGSTKLNASISPDSQSPEVGKVDQVAPDVYFHVGDISIGHSNNGWIVFEDYVLVIDANYPSGAKDIIPKIQAITGKPIRFAFDTHHHGDHVYGNQTLVDSGATPLAHTGVIEEMKRYETGYYGNKPGRWEADAKERPDVRASKLKPPSLLFPKELYFDDGTHRVELLHLGVAHTHGDAVAWLPRERILFAGDVCVNGPHNFVGDGNVEKWIATLDAARKLGARVVCPGHGLRGADTMLADQQQFFQVLRARVGSLVRAKKTPQEIKDSVAGLHQEMAAIASISRYVGSSFASQVEKVFTELTGERFPAVGSPSQAARLQHARSHGLQWLA